MSTTTSIEWTETSWNPVLGCSKVSAGCQRCYAVGHVHRMAGNPNATIAAANAGLTARHRNGQLDWTGVVRLIPERLPLPLTWSTPRRVFVNSLSDLFHEGLTADEIARIWAVMALTPQHTYQVLTKRPERIRAVLAGEQFYRRTLHWANHYRGLFPRKRLGDVPVSNPATSPLDNVWLGTSVEDQAAADVRIPHLLAAPARVRFLSCEPLLGPLDLSGYIVCCPSCRRTHTGYCESPNPWPLHWVIIGGESGPGARPIQARWVNNLLSDVWAECEIPTFVKQTGTVWAKEHGYADRKGGDPSEWPYGWRIREYPRKVARV